LKKVTHLPIFSVEILCVREIDPLHDARYRVLGCFDQEMNVIPHKNKRIKNETACVFVSVQSFKVPSAIGIVKEDILFLITPDDDVVKSSLKLYARFPCHPMTVYLTICINASLTLCLST
jgi:hypothetical protein